MRESNPHFPSVPPIQTVKGRVVFFRAGHEKISTLIPLTVWIFAVAFRRRKRGTGFQKSRSPFPSAPFYGKTGSTTTAVAVSFCGAARPAPPASTKEQNEKSVSGRCYALDSFPAPGSRRNTGFSCPLRRVLRAGKGFIPPAPESGV